MAQDGKKKKQFFKDFKAELKKVIWPTPKQLVNGTIAVITIVLVAAVIVFVLDLTFEMFNEYGVNRLKESIEKNQETVQEEKQKDEEGSETDTDTESETPTDENEVDNEDAV